MDKLFNSEFEVAQQIADLGIRFNYLVSLQRSILQTAAISAIEYCSEFQIEAAAGDLSRQMLSPVDGTPLMVLDRLIPRIRQHGWSSCAKGWYPSDTKDALISLVERWVRFRNNRPGHGVVDLKTVSDSLEWLPSFTQRLLTDLSDLIPISSPDGILELETPKGKIPSHTLRLINGCPIVIRKISRRGSIWLLRYQTVDIHNSKEGHYDLPIDNPLLLSMESREGPFIGHRILVGDMYWYPTVCLPKRQTASFCGRDKERERLREWYEDQDSRACLVYGEGGIGKTTLVLEFLNNILETPNENLMWRPEVLVFYSAKQTRWSPSGLEFIRGISPAVADGVRLLVQVLEDDIGKQWYDEDPKATIDRAVQLFRDVGIRRDQILLVLDNTETMARTLGEEDKLAALITRISSRLARVLVTSRRRERVEARPIRIMPMDTEIGCSLLQQLGEAYHAEPIKQAGSSKLKSISQKLSGRPLLLDVFARQVSRVGQSLDSALRTVLEDTAHELGTFLFEDAWERIPEDHQQVFLTLSKLGDTIDNQLTSWVCGEVGVPHDEWLEAFEETRFGNIIDYGNRYDIQLCLDTRMFLDGKYEEAERASKNAVDRYADKVTRRYNQYLRAQKYEITDRVKHAFRTSAAKAAKVAANSGRIDDATVWYEEAVRVDEKNAALWDRFAWFLMVMVGDLERAEECANHALKLDPDDADASFTAGMIAGRRGNVNVADTHLQKAAELGKPVHLVNLQKARSRVEALENNSGNADRLCSEAERLIKAAETLPGATSWRREKHLEECKRLGNRLSRLRSRLLGPVVRVKKRRKKTAKDEPARVIHLTDIFPEEE